MSVYQAIVDPAERNTSHTMMLELVGSDKDVLDVGCASGYLAEALGRNGCRVSGIEYDPLEAEKARPFLVELAVADLNTVDLAEQFPGRQYDAIVFGDVLEHLLRPEAVLASSLSLLRPGGSIVISIPNVAHGAVRLSLLQGRWNYSDTGLLDRTHIRFFTFDTLLAMLENAGLSVTELRSTVADPLSTEIPVEQTVLPPEAVDWVRRQAHSLAYQFVLTAQPAEGGAVDHVRHVVPAVAPPEVRDVHAEVAVLNAEAVELRQEISSLQAQIAGAQGELAQHRAMNTALRRTVLTSRDHAIGHEAQVGKLRADLATVRHQLHTTTLDAQYAHSELAKSIKDAQNAHARLARAMWYRHPIRHGVLGIAAVVRKAVGPRIWKSMTAPIRPRLTARRAGR